jgi:hypothetical protein
LGSIKQQEADVIQYMHPEIPQQQQAMLNKDVLGVLHEWNSISCGRFFLLPGLHSEPQQVLHARR